MEKCTVQPKSQDTIPLIQEQLLKATSLMEKDREKEESKLKCLNTKTPNNMKCM